jgi:hypothetical protein
VNSCSPHGFDSGAEINVALLARQARYKSSTASLLSRFSHVTAGPELP